MYVSRSETFQLDMLFVITVKKKAFKDFKISAKIRAGISILNKLRDILYNSQKHLPLSP